MLTLARNWELTGFVLYLLVDTAVLALGALWRRKHWASYLISRPLLPRLCRRPALCHVPAKRLVGS